MENKKLTEELQKKFKFNPRGQHSNEFKIFQRTKIKINPDRNMTIAERMSLTSPPSQS